MFASLLQQIFLRADGGLSAMAGNERTSGLCDGALSDAVEQVVDQLHPRLRAISNYARVLEGPIANTFRHVDAVAESIPGPLICSRASFADNPLVNAFFISPHHVQEVFSQSEEVRRLFDTNPLAGECWALLCMRKLERRQPGLAIVNDALRRDVMQTSISFSDHQLVSPGADEIAARCALKCCMLNGLLAHIRRNATEAKTTGEDLENRLSVLNNRLRRMPQEGDPEDRRAKVMAQIRDLEQQLAGQKLRLHTIKDHLDYVAWALDHPSEFLSAERCSLRLSRMAVKLEEDNAEGGRPLELSEIRIASHHPRIAALVRFPRAELLPQPDLLKRADLFLGV